jgi:iron complex transport system permease protein
MKQTDEPRFPEFPERPQQFGLSAVTYSGLLFALVGIFVLDLSVGSVEIPLDALLNILIGGEPERASWKNILWLFRLPKAMTAGLAGSGLAVSGLLMQTLFRNPLAGPSVLGINSGASLGVALVVLTATAGGAGADFLDGLGFIGDLGITAAASLGAALVLTLILFFARKVRSVMTLLILGVLFGYATSALVSVLIQFSIAERIQAYISWTFGSFAATTWQQLRIFIPVVLAGLLLTLFAQKPLNAMLLGEAYGRSLGLHIKRFRFFLIVVTALLSGSVTAFCGPVAFLGVAIPHLCRSFFNTSDHRILLPAVMIVGAIVALIADLVSQMPGSQTVLPLNAVTSLIGAPVIAWFILRKRNLNETFAV